MYISHFNIKFYLVESQHYNKVFNACVGSFDNLLLELICVIKTNIGDAVGFLHSNHFFFSEIEIFVLTYNMYMAIYIYYSMINRLLYFILLVRLC